MNQSEINNLKVEIRESQLDHKVAKARNQLNRYDDPTLMLGLIKDYGYIKVVYATRLNASDRNRTFRIKDKVKEIVYTGHCLFLTLTFKDSVLDKTSRQTRRRYVSRFLKSNCKGYVANIDFGNAGKKRVYSADDGTIKESTAREHYHALVYSEHVNLSAWHKYGGVKVEHVRTSDKDLRKVSRYVAKLSAHAQKDNGGIAPRLVYSRGDHFFEDLFPW